jgi:hypothetical protein
MTFVRQVRAHHWQSARDSGHASPFISRYGHTKRLTCLTNYDGKLPDGQISKNLSSPADKNISLNPSGKSPLEARPSHPKRGGSRSSRTRGGMRWTRQCRAQTGLQGGFSRERSTGARTYGAAAHLRRNSADGTRSGETFGGDGRGRRSRVVLAPRCWCQVLRRCVHPTGARLHLSSARRRWQESPVTGESAK